MLESEDDLALVLEEDEDEDEDTYLLLVKVDQTISLTDISTD